MPDDREHLGRMVRETWVAWAKEQRYPEPSWLLSYDEIDEGLREAAMRIGELLASAGGARAARDARDKLAAIRMLAGDGRFDGDTMAAVLAILDGPDG